jgi:hypothetical protein
MKTELQVKALQSELDRLFEKHQLTGFAWHDGEDVTEEQKAEGGEKTYFKMGFDGDLYYVFWPLPAPALLSPQNKRSARSGRDRVVLPWSLACGVLRP